jgi:hypothetical protein
LESGMIGSDQTELFDVTELIIGVILSLHSAHLYNYYLFTIATRTCLYSLSTFTLHVSITMPQNVSSQIITQATAVITGSFLSGMSSFYVQFT